MPQKSIFNRLLISLQEKIIAEIPDSEATPGVRYVEQDLGQIDIEGQRPSISLPALLVDFDAAYDQKQNKTQWAQMIITFRLIYDPYGSSSSITPIDVREKTLVYYEIENKLYEVLQDWQAELLMIGLKRISASTEKERKDMLRVRIIKFKATYEDKVLQALQP